MRGSKVCYVEYSEVYEIKLKRENQLTTIYTQNYELFASFYNHMARLAILTTFEKHYKI